MRIIILMNGLFYCRSISFYIMGGGEIRYRKYLGDEEIVFGEFILL